MKTYNENDKLLYLNTANVLYILKQLENRYLIFMNTGRKIIVNTSLDTFFERVNKNYTFVECRLKENDLVGYLNLKSIESAFRCDDTSIYVRFTSGLSIIINNDTTLLDLLYEVNFEK